MPHLSYHVQSLLRFSCGLLLLFTLAHLFPNRKNFFYTERWGGYAQNGAERDWIQNPTVFHIIFFVWAACGLGLVLGRFSILAAFVNVLFSYEFFIRQRWTSLLRGLGAPGFMTWWLATAVFSLELATRYFPHQRSLVLLSFQLDFALIMLSAGIYKLTAGYARNQGMELGLANSMWSYAWRFYSRRSPDHLLFKTLNHLGWATEVTAAVLMLIPTNITRALGALLIATSFFFILTQIRLSWLCETVIVCALLFVPAGTAFDGYLLSITISLADRFGWAAYEVTKVNLAPVLGVLFGGLVIAYLILRPLTLLGLYWNFYGKRKFVRPVQALLEKYSNFFGIIIWRVFTREVTNFEIMISRIPVGESAQIVSNYGSLRNWRFNHVGESIAVVTLFTTLKYYSDWSLFERKLIRYCESLDPRQGDIFEFQYVVLKKEKSGFKRHMFVLFTVDLTSQAAQMKIIDPEGTRLFSINDAASHICAKPGSYAPGTPIGVLPSS